MFRLSHPEFLYLYLLVPVFVLLFIFIQFRKKRAIIRLGDPELTGRLLEEVSSFKQAMKFLLLLLAFSSLVFALSGPQLGTRLQDVKREGVDVVIALDVSNSMNAEDIRPSRLERSKQAIYRLVDRLQGDRIGLIVFAGQAYVQLPITTDYGAAKLFLSTINTGIVPVQGTAIGTAIRKAMETIGDSARTHSAVIVITDGENHEDDALEAAKEAKSKGIIVHTVGMGSPDGTPVPQYRGGTRVGFLTDRLGNTVMTKLDEATLQQIADAGRGKYVRASNSDDGLALIMKEIESMEKKEFSSKLFTDYEDQFQYFSGLTLLLLLMEFIISERKSKLIKKLNLFGDKKS